MESLSKKVLLVLPFFYPHRGGSQKYAEELYATLIKRHSNVEVDVLCYNTDHVTDHEEYRGMKIYRVPCWNIILARFALAHPIALINKLKQLSSRKYDFVNTHIRFFDPTWWLWIYAKQIKAKSIFTGHVATHPTHQSKIVAFVAKLVDLTLAKWALQHYDFLTFTNKSAIKFFNERLGTSNKKTYLIYGGVDTKLFTPSSRTSTRVIPKVKLPIEPDTTVVTFLGRLIWTKGVTYLYEAAKIILQEHPNVVFVLGGPGELEEDMKKQVQQDQLQDKVILTGNLSYAEVQELYGISDIFINPSHHNEGFPNTILEAGASECYVIATDNAGTYEVVRDGETGSLIPQKDVKTIVNSVTWALENPEKRKEIARTFRNELVEKFDWEIIAEEYYTQIIEQK